VTVLTATPICLPVSEMLSGLVWTPSPGTAATVSYDFLPQIPASLTSVPTGDPAELADAFFRCHSDRLKRSENTTSGGNFSRNFSMVWTGVFVSTVLTA
jgi:hypothetical protein